MRTTSYLALSRQAALERDMTVIANNLANVTTAGFRATRTVFDEVMVRAGRRELAFVQDVAQTRDPTPGPITQTGSPLDLALDGAGYLSFASDAGIRYARSARLEIAADGRLIDAGGHTPLDEGGNPIVPPGEERAPTIAGDGTLSGRSGPLARLGVAAFASEQDLVPVGAGRYEAQRPALTEGARARVVQGALEGSNVQPVLEMTTLLASVRAFEGAQRLVETEHELERQAIERAVRASG